MKTKLVFLLTLYLAALAIAMEEDTNSLEQVEMKLTRAMDVLNEKDNIEIYGDMVTLEKIAVKEDTETSRTSDPLVRRIERFFRTRRVRIHLPNDGSSADLFGRALGQKDVDVELRGLARGASEARTKLKRIAIPIILLLKLKTMIVLPIIITLIGLVGIKGISVGLMSLLISGAVALKALLTPPPPYPARITYGIAKPEVYHDQWHRSQEEINQPYRGWAPEYNQDPYQFQELP